ncbi:MAG: hypothetical protein MUC69_11740, partial [Gemmatimonadales bacterium]|jgi:hypothetical protein|nr:hypothetical protein [Gemmatimonadales bacterium]
MGFDKPRKIAPNAQGGRLAAPAWTLMMKEVYERRRVPGGWGRPADLVVAEVDTTSGGLATPFCPREFRLVESYAPGTAPVAYCPAHSQLLGVPGMTPADGRTGGGAEGRVVGGEAEGRTGGGAEASPSSGTTGAAAAIPGAATASPPARLPARP